MRYIFISFFLAVAATLAAAAEKNDTIAVIERPTLVTVKNENGSTTLTVKGKENNSNYSYTYQTNTDIPDSLDLDFVEPSISDFNLPFMRKTEKTSRNSASSFRYSWFNNIYGGSSIISGSGGIISGSLELGVLNIIRLNQQLWRRGPVLSVGFGMGYQRINAGKHLLDYNDGIIFTVEPDGDMTKISSHFKSMHLFVPLLLSYKICNRVNISAGAVLDFNTYTSGHTQYSVGNTSVKRSIEGLHQRLLSVQPTAIVGIIDLVGISVRYSPASYFRKGYGPDFSLVSIGLNLNLDL